ncbi:MAG: phosphoribosylformylglycinamidine synthase subunit PurQ [Oligoflexia bacterium]|nr:phosphoribosylformylglycinamidine synthase subunit PurQ [Oligoflexia bacterium]
MPKNQREVKSLIICGNGFNCEQEMARAYTLAGAAVTLVHMNDLLKGSTAFSLFEFDLLNFPGGFSYGDELGSGQAIANKIRFSKRNDGKTFYDDLMEFITRGKFIIGICNGFQILVKLGLLPNNRVTLAHNDCGKFIDRWCTLKINPKNRSPFFKNFPENTITLPIRHGEGKFSTLTEEDLLLLTEENLHLLQYSEGDNPNGSALSIAALTDPRGQILGMMPHPEAFLFPYNHPTWTRKRRDDDNFLNTIPDGLRFFKNIVEHIAYEH